MTERSDDPEFESLTSSGTLDLTPQDGRAATPAPRREVSVPGGSASPEPGTLLGGRFEILSRLGEGGMGVVFKARDRVLEEVVALKTVRGDLPDRAEVMRRFRSEIRLARRIRHVNVAGMYDLLEADGLAFVTMEHVEGSDLRALIAAGTLGTGERLSVVRQLCLGLGAAHERGVVHRDLKPANVMVAPDGRAVILDFGIARSVRAGEATVGLVFGTPQYMAPEQARGEPAGPAADLYSLGVLTYELFTGRLPFRGDTPLEYVLKQIGEEPEPPSRFGPLPPGLEAVILTAMRKDPSLRYPDAARLLEALSRVGTEPEATVRTPAAPLAPARPERKRLCLASLQASGFERLSAEIEVDEIRHVRRDVLSSLESAVVRFGGTVVGREETGLLAAFSLPAVRETDAEKALASARAGVAVLSRLDTRLRARLELRAGLHADHLLVSTGPGGAPELVGEASDVARAAASEAPAGGVAFSGPFAALLPRGAATAGPVLTRVRAGDGRVDVFVDPGEREGEALERFEGPMVGRGAELETARAILRRVASGPGELLGIVGDAGIGKSRLVFEVAEAARAAGFSVFAGSCRTLEEQAVLQPVEQLLRAALALPGELPAGAELDDLVARRLAAEDAAAPSLVPAVVALLGGVHPRIAALTDVERRAAFREAVVALLAARARRAPVLLVLEDAHWLDPASADVLSAVASASPGLRLLLCAVYRPEWAPPWAGDEAFTRLAVRPLADEEVATLAARRAGARELAPELLALLKERAEGNPFFVEELLGTLGDRGALGVEGGRAVLARGTGAAGLPARIEEVVLARIDRLEEQAKEALRSAAVIGRSFPVRLLDRLLGHDPEPRELPALTGAGMVYRKEILPELQYLFRHVVIRDVAYASLVEKRRRELHGRLAACIEELYADRLDEWWEALGRHHEEAGAFEKAKRCYGQAAARARERVTNDVSDALAGKEERMAEALMEAKVESRVPAKTVVRLGIVLFVAISAAMVPVLHSLGWPGGIVGMLGSRTGLLKILIFLGVALATSVFVAAALALGFWYDAAFLRRQRLAFVVHSDRLTVGTRRGALVLPFEEISEVFGGTLRELMPTPLGMSVCDEGQATDAGRAAFVRWPRPRPVFSFGGAFRGGRCLFLRKRRDARGSFLERTPYVLETGLVVLVLAVLALAFVAIPPPARKGVAPLVAAWTVLAVLFGFLLDIWYKRWLTGHLPAILAAARLVAIRTPDVEELEKTLRAALEKYRREEAARAGEAGAR